MSSIDIVEESRPLIDTINIEDDSMMRKSIDEIASEASMILQQIPFSKQGDIAVSTGFSGDPTVSYAPSADGYYETIKERGDSTSYKVANDEQEMQDYFIRKAILAYAYRYEFRHRRKFEDNRRQIDEIITLCYQYIDPEKAFNHQPYNDKGHIYLDLLDEYHKETYDFRNEHHAQYLKMKDDIDYIADKKYTDSPHGGMSDLSKSMLSVRERIARISQRSSELKAKYDKYEKYYELLGI